MSLLESPSGHLTNLSTVPAAPEDGEAHVVPFFPSASDPLGRQGFVRVANRSGVAGEVAIAAYDDGGSAYGTATLALDAGQTAHFNPGGNRDQASSLRLVNPGDADAEVTVTGLDDRGESPGGAVTLTVPAGASRTLGAAELESGGDGFEGGARRRGGQVAPADRLGPADLGDEPAGEPHRAPDEPLRRTRARSALNGSRGGRRGIRPRRRGTPPGREFLLRS